MTNFRCKKCGEMVDGLGIPNHWLCPKCRHKVLAKELFELNVKQIEETENFQKANEDHIKKIKQLKGIGSISGSGTSGSKKSTSQSSQGEPPEDPDFIPSSVQSNKRCYNCKLFQTKPEGSKKTKVQETAQNSSNFATSSKIATIPSSSRAINIKTPIPTKKSSAKLNLHAKYKGDNHFYPTLEFNNGIVM